MGFKGNTSMENSLRDSYVCNSILCLLTTYFHHLFPSKLFFCVLSSAEWLSVGIFSELCLTGRGRSRSVFYSPGQLSVLQSSLSCRSPGQSAPPCKGNGSSQNRCLLLLPPLQPLSQTVHEDHCPHAPTRGTSTESYQFKAVFIVICTTENFDHFCHVTFRYDMQTAEGPFLVKLKLMSSNG